VILFYKFSFATRSAQVPHEGGNTDLINVLLPNAVCTMENSSDDERNFAVIAVSS